MRPIARHRAVALDGLVTGIDIDAGPRVCVLGAQDRAARWRRTISVKLFIWSFDRFHSLKGTSCKFASRRMLRRKSKPMLSSFRCLPMANSRARLPKPIPLRAELADILATAEITGKPNEVSLIHAKDQPFK